MKKKSHLGLGLVSSPYLKPWPIFSAKPPASLRAHLLFICGRILVRKTFILSTALGRVQMKVLKIWFLGALTLQALIWTYMFILSTVEPAAAWLIFVSFYALIISGLQLPALAGVYYLLKDKIERWRWWHSCLLWIGRFALTLLLVYFLPVVLVDKIPCFSVFIII